jgi:nondiscriminating glutamyl-tRNA synthetase
MSDTAVRVRFAPSPTGLLHVGATRTALFNWLYARHTGGRFILRIEDTDQDREVAEAVDVIRGVLTWLGVDWDEGPDVGGDFGPYFQSERGHLYREAAEALRASGKAYPCFCTQEQLAEGRERAQAEGRPFHYDGRCRDLPADEVARRIGAGERFVLRCRIPDIESIVVDDLVRGHVVFDRREFDDFIILKSDGAAVYNLANVVDDATMRITHVIRGEDLLPSTPRQLVLYRALGYEPPVFAHAPMITKPGGGKISKRDMAKSVLDYGDEGLLPETIVNFLALLGWSPGDERELFSAEELVGEFVLERISPAPAVFDPTKMEWLNAQHIKQASAERLLRDLLPRLRAAGLVGEAAPLAEDEAYLLRVVDVMKERCRTLNQLGEYMAYFLTEEYAVDEKGARKRLPSVEGMPAALRGLTEALEAVETYEPEAVEGAFRARCDAMGFAQGDAIHGARVAVSGQTVGPGVFDLLAVLGRERTVARLRRVADAMDAGAYPPAGAP